MSTIRLVSGLDWCMTETCQYGCQSIFCTDAGCCQHRVEFIYCYTSQHPTFCIPKLVHISGYECTIIKCEICGHKWRCATYGDLHQIVDIWSHFNARHETLRSVTDVLTLGKRDTTNPLQFLSSYDIMHIIGDYMIAHDDDDDDDDFD